MFRRMTKQNACWLLLALIAVAGIGLGGLVYEARVIVPLWSGNPPESVGQWNAHTLYRIEPGPVFWWWVTPLSGLLAVGMLAVSSHLEARARLWVRIGAGLTAAMVLLTLVWYTPQLSGLLGPQSLAIDRGVVQVRTEAWVSANRLRVVCQLGAWACLLIGLAGGLPRREKA
jgi:hypothetical protein